MPRFVFELESVLKARQAEERQRQLAVASLERERARIEGEIRAAQDAILQARADLRDRLGAEALGTQIDLAAVRLQAGASLHLAARAQHAVLALAGVHARLNEARLALLAAATRRKAVEALRERRLEDFRDAERRRETRADDELGVQWASRREPEP